MGYVHLLVVGIHLNTALLNGKKSNFLSCLGMAEFGLGFGLFFDHLLLIQLLALVVCIVTLYNWILAPQFSGIGCPS